MKTIDWILVTACWSFLGGVLVGQLMIERRTRQVLALTRPLVRDAEREIANARAHKLMARTARESAHRDRMFAAEALKALEVAEDVLDGRASVEQFTEARQRLVTGARV